MRIDWRDFTKGLFNENPIFRVVLGLCPTLAITTSVINGVAMGLATTFVLVFSNLFISALRKFIPDIVRIPGYILVIASFVTIVDLAMNAWTHEVYKTLGIFIPLIVVNCIIMGRAEAFAGKNPIIPSFLDGLGMGVGFTGALILISGIREFLGSGTFLGISILSANFPGILVMILPPGAFFVMGTLLWFFNALDQNKT